MPRRASALAASEYLLWDRPYLSLSLGYLLALPTVLGGWQHCPSAKGSVICTVKLELFLASLLLRAISLREKCSLKDRPLLESKHRRTGKGGITQEATKKEWSKLSSPQIHPSADIQKQSFSQSCGGCLTTGYHQTPLLLLSFLPPSFLSGSTFLCLSLFHHSSYDD